MLDHECASADPVRALEEAFLTTAAQLKGIVGVCVAHHVEDDFDYCCHLPSMQLLDKSQPFVDPPRQLYWLTEFLASYTLPMWVTHE